MNVNKLIEKGEDASKKRNYDYAISIFLEAVSFAPNNRKAREGLRTAALKKHEKNYPSAAAIAIFGLGAKLGMFLAGLSKKGNPEGYMMACERFLRLDPKNKVVNMKLGDAAAHAGHLEAAIFAYETAAEHNPHDVTALKQLGKLLWKNGQIKRAHEVYDRAVQLAPQDQEAIKARKNLAAEASLKETGFETAASSIDLIKDKNIAGEIEKEARLYQSDSDLAAQRAQLEKRIEEEPENAELLQDLAEVCQKTKDWDAAVAAQERATKLKPGDSAVQFALGDLKMTRIEEEIYALKRSGKKAEAERKEQELLSLQTEEFRARVKAYPTDLNLRFKLGDLLYRQGQLEEAIGQFQQTVRDPKYKSASQLRLGRAFAAKGQHSLAIRQLEQALEGQSGMTERVKEILYALGDVHEKDGNADKAKEYFGRIYEADIGFQDVGDRLNKLDSPA